MLKFLSFKHFILSCIITVIACDQPSNSTPQSSFDLNDYELEFTELISAEELPFLPTNFAYTPDESGLIIIGQGGEVFAYQQEETSQDVFVWKKTGSFQIDEVGPVEGGVGLVGLAIDPNFTNNSTFYLAYTTSDNQNEKVVAYRWKDDFALSVSSAKNIISFPRAKPRLYVHGITSIEFGESRNLYLTVGESNQQDTAQSGDKFNGKLLKIIPLPDGGYLIPEDNPFIDNENVQDEIVALGLRSPFRASTFEDYVFIGDVGHKAYEEVNLYRPGHHNFAWPMCEGPCSDSILPEGSQVTPIVVDSLVEPLIAYERSGDFAFEDEDVINTTRASVAVGPYLYVEDLTEAKLDENPLLYFNEHLIFFDVLIGFIRAVPLAKDELSSVVNPMSFNIGHFEYISAMRQNSKGEIFVTRLADNSYNVEKPSFMQMKLVLKEELR